MENTACSVRDSLQAELDRKGLRLKFPQELEQLFLSQYLYRTVNQMRVALALGVLMYGVFAILDAWILPDAKKVAWVMRFVVVCPMLAALLVYTYRDPRDKTVQIAWAVIMFTAGLGPVVMFAASHADTVYRYYTGIILVIIYCYVFTRMRLPYATVSAVWITLSYLVVAPWFKQIGIPVLMNDVFFLIAANVIGMQVCYLREQSERKDFLKTELLSLDKESLTLANRGLQELSMVDELTGIGNRRQFDVFFHREWKGAQRECYPLSFLMIDVDRFKDFNDHYGHQAGDGCLVRIAGVIKTFARRPGDMAVRYGGEEFAVVLVGAHIDDAAVRGEVLRAAVENLGIAHEACPLGVVTVSVGLAAVMPTPEMEMKELVEAADHALYRAKNAGRNRVCR